MSFSKPQRSVLHGPLDKRAVSDGTLSGFNNPTVTVVVSSVSDTRSCEKPQLRSSRALVTDQRMYILLLRWFMTAVAISLNVRMNEMATILRLLTLNFSTRQRESL